MKIYYFVVLLALKQVSGNKYCLDGCKSCSSGFNFLSVSCLNHCPSGYYLFNNTCKANQSQELFTIDFALFRNFDSYSIGTFSHPENYKFANESKSTPIPTLDRGFYFFSSSFLASNTSWILGPRFCLGIVYRVLGPGTIFIIMNDTKVYFEMKFDGTTIYQYSYTDGVSDYEEAHTYSHLGTWVIVNFVLTQQLNYLSISFPGFSRNYPNREFRMDSNESIFIIGSPNNSSFTGFISYLSISNSNACRTKTFESNDCLINQYYSENSCYTCLDSCSSLPHCIREGCNFCYSTNCSSCAGYLLDTCQQCSNTSLDACSLGKNCLTGSGFNCSVCLEDYVLINGLCVSPPTNSSEITLRLDCFSMYQGLYFQSGNNASTYSPFNNPETDDPVALNNRGYWFHNIQFMKADNFTLNYSFTVGLWAYTHSSTLISCNKLTLMTDGSFVLSLHNYENSFKENVDGDCYSATWRVIGMIVDFYNYSTHISLVCGLKITKIQSISGYAFYDSPGEFMIISKYSSNFIYRVIIRQFAFYDLSNFLIACSIANDKSCLGPLSHLQYINIFTHKTMTCHSSCTRGCSTWGSCNKCKSIMCPVCDSFDNNCDEDLSISPCAAGYNLSEDNRSCCAFGCSICHGDTTDQCSKCIPDYFQVGSLCTKNCPSGFTLNGNICSYPLNQSTLNITFNKIVDSFNDSFNNQFFTGKDQNFYPNLTLNDPIPSQSRGFYFKNSSFIDTSNFSIPINFSISFWLRQSSIGTLLRKGQLTLTPNTFTYSSRVYSIEKIPDNAWCVVDFIGVVLYDIYRVRIRVISFSEKYFDTNLNFEDPFSPIRIGAESNGFVGFIWRFVVFYGSIPQTGPVICSQNIKTECLWDCSLNSFFFNGTCRSCLNSCSEGCVRSSDCNLCLDHKCFECLEFDNNCKTCTANATKNTFCECDIGLYWDISKLKCLECMDHCAECQTKEICTRCDQNFTFNGSMCVCNPGLYFSDGECWPCNISCSTCFGPFHNNCESCSTVQYLANSTCFCSERFYLLGPNCYDCPQDCLFCENSLKCLVCDESFLILDNFCVCPDRTFKGYKSLLSRCLSCHDSCFNCFDSNYFSCNSCEKSLLNGICYEICPVGFSADKGFCVLKNVLALKFQFDSDFPLLEKITKTISTLSCKPSKADPFQLYQRGLFFPEYSSCIEYKNKKRPLLPPVFSFSFWLKVMMNSEVFSFKTSETFGFVFEVSSKSCLHLFLDNQNFNLCIEEKKNDWNHFLFTLANDSFYIITGKVNNEQLTQEILSYLPYKDFPGSLLIFGSHSDQKFVGFLFSFEIFTSEPEYLEIAKIGINCPYFPLVSSECLSTCGPYQYENDKICDDCDKQCIFGCLNSSSCIDCSNPPCDICNNLNPESCYSCQAPFELSKGKCKSCHSTEYYSMISEKCEPCPTLCLSCSSNSICSSCISESHLLNNSTCECLFGYFLEYDKCSKLYFKLGIQVSTSNLINLIFSEALRPLLKSKDMIIIVNSTEVTFQMNSTNSSYYTIEILIPDKLKSLSNLKAVLKFIENITSVNGANLEKSFYGFGLFDIVAEEDVQVLNDLQETGKTVTTASAAAALASGAILMNPTMIFNLLSLVEMFSYALLFDLEFHSKFIDFVVSLKKSSKLPSLHISFKRKERKLPKKYETYGISSSLLVINAGYLILILFLMGLISIISHFGTYFKFERAKKIAQKIKETIYFSWFNRMCIQSCFDLSVYLLISLVHSDFSDWVSGVDFFFCCVVFLFMVFCVFIQFYCALELKFPVDDPQLKERFPYFFKLFEEFDCASWNKCMFSVIYIIRRVFLSVSIIYLNGIFQLTIGISFCLMNIFYLLLVRPFKQVSENYIFFFNEILLLVFYLGLIIRELGLMEVKLEGIAVFGIRNIIITLGFNLLSNVMKIVQKIVSFIRDKCKSRISKVAALNQTTTSNQIEKYFE